MKIDASKRGLGAVLMQRGHSIAYLSNLTILLAIDKQRAYLQTASFTIVADRRSFAHV